MTRRWHIEEIEPGEALIQNGHVIVGSIKRIGVVWFVEILWSGPGGDIKTTCDEYGQVTAFVEGVEKTLAALGVSDPRAALQVHGEPGQ